jgi:hypothetical protein
MKMKLTQEQIQELITTLKSRFEKNMNRHKNLQWDKIQSRLENNSEKLTAVYEMERTGGEPDITGYNDKTDEYIICDCSPESPEGRRNTCYDREGQESREKKGVRPAGNALDMASSMSIEMLTEEQYHELQKLGNFDTKTSSWLKTPPEIRKLGGAIFADRRFGRVFIYHNSAPSFYSVRGFRGRLVI